MYFNTLGQFNMGKCAGKGMEVEIYIREALIQKIF